MQLLAAGVVSDEEEIQQGNGHGHGHKEQAGKPVQGEPDAVKFVSEDGLTGEEQQDRQGQKSQADHAPGSTGRVRHGLKVGWFGRVPKEKSERCRGGTFW
jgi:hypothetical protein